jgi:hypothetical protein
MNARATLLANHTLIFLQGDSTNNVRQYKQVCEKAKAKVECWEASQVVAQWKVYAPKLAPSDKKTCDCVGLYFHHCCLLAVLEGGCVCSLGGL